MAKACRCFQMARSTAVARLCKRESARDENELGITRVARNFPAIFPALADGRLNLSGILILDPYLSTDTADELLAAASHKTNKEIEALLAERFPRPDAPERVQVLVSPCRQLAVRPIELSPGRFRLEVTMDQEMSDDLSAIQDLMGEVKLSEVVRRAFKLVRRRLEARKFGASCRPRGQCGANGKSRHVPTAVRREVWHRDGGRCTFVGDMGHRCETRRFLEFDHIVPFARGGDSTVDNLRLRCRAHNQLEAERVYGREFMDQKKEDARNAAAAREQIEDVVSGLRNLGVPAARARRAAESTAVEPEASIEQRMRAALRWLVPRRVPAEYPAATP